MPFLKKAQAGADSFGHHWDSDGAIVEVTHDEALALLAIPDAGFTEVPAPTKHRPAKKDDLSEVAPDPEQPADEAPKPRRRRTTVEE